MRELIRNFIAFCHRIIRIDIVKVFSFTAISTLVKMLTGLVSVKIVASIIGPAGVALVGQLNNFASIVMTVSSGGITSGITKYVAEYKKDKNEIIALFSTAFRVIVMCSLAVGVILIIFHQYLSEYIMLSPEYGYVFVIFGFTVLLYALNMMLTSIINGFKDFKRYVKISIANSIIGLLFTLLLVLTWGLEGALISVVTYQSIMFLVTLWMIRKLPWLSWNYFREKLSILITKKFFRYTLMTITIAITLPISQMLLRGYVISEISPIEAGWWEAMNRISNMYLMVITSSLSVYYLPRMSELTDTIELRHEIIKCYKVIIPILIVGFTLTFLIRKWIIYLLFTPDFLPMQSLFLWQLGGDFFKMCSWVLSYLLIAKAMSNKFIVAEISFSFLFLILGFVFMQINGVIGITQGYLLNYVLYLLYMIYIFRKLLFAKFGS